MRIISKFQDYYDSAMGLGVDKSLVYKRVSEPGEFITSAPRWSFGAKEEVHYAPVVTDRDELKIVSWVVPLIFCGKLYLRGMVDVKISVMKGEILGQVTERYSGSTRKQALDRVREKFNLDERTEKKSRLYRWESRDDRVSFGEWARAQDWIPVHIREGCPILSIRNLTQEEQHDRRKIYSYSLNPVYRIEKNPRLHDLGFFQEKDAYNAFQEIAMFLGGVMGSAGNPMVQLTDKEVHQKHGFDKWSFRKMPEAR